MQDQPLPLDPFVGRAAELAQVAEVVSQAESGQPWLVAIEGDPGIGIIDQLLRAASQPCRFSCALTALSACARFVPGGLRAAAFGHRGPPAPSFLQVQA
jgi:hypothetical protein